MKLAVAAARALGASEPKRGSTSISAASWSGRADTVLELAYQSSGYWSKYQSVRRGCGGSCSLSTRAQRQPQKPVLVESTFTTRECASQKTLEHTLFLTRNLINRNHNSGSCHSAYAICIPGGKIEISVDSFRVDDFLAFLFK